VRLREGRHDEARELFARAQQLDPSNKWRSLMATATFWGMISKARDANKQGKPAEAEALARKALAQQPGNDSAEGILADALIAQNKDAEAEALLRKMLARPKPDMGALRSLVELLQKEHRDAEIDPLIASVEPRMKGSERNARDACRPAFRCRRNGCWRSRSAAPPSPTWRHRFGCSPTTPGHASRWPASIATWDCPRWAAPSWTTVSRPRRQARCAMRRRST
jgi:tetratricopeptide (TPR) repeat protein